MQTHAQAPEQPLAPSAVPAVPAVPGLPAATALPGLPVLPGLPGTELPGGAPQTTEQFAALRRHRSEISDQLTSVQHRRDELARQLRNPMVGGADRAGIEQRLTLIDGRIVSLERDLDATGQLIAVAPTTLLASTGLPGGNPRRGGFRAGFGAGAMLALLAALLYTRLFRRARPTSARRAAADAPADSARLARVEQAIEAVAIEIERISEGQRFVTQLLAERRDDARIVAPAYATAPGEPRS